MARPRKHTTDRRDRKIILWVTDREHARFLINAATGNQTAPDYARSLICNEPSNSRPSNDKRSRTVQRELDFARIDALNRLGASIDQLLRVATRTGHLPAELGDVAQKIDTLLDDLLPS